MSNKEKTINNTQESEAGSGPKKSMVAKIIGGFTWWISSITGKTKPTTSTSVSSQANQQTPTENSTGEQAAPQGDVVQEEDSIAEDIKKFKSFFMKKKQNIQTKIAPTTSKIAEQTGQAVDQTAKKVGLLSLLKIVTFVFIIVLLVILGLKLFSTVRNGGGNGGNGNGESTPTPTPVSYQPYVPSLYAQDKEVLKLEEDINVLSRELSTTIFRETRLNPPQLDFSISF